MNSDNPIFLIKELTSITSHALARKLGVDVSSFCGKWFHGTSL